MTTEIFVFGSNRAGVHGAGAALDARRFYGAEHGIGEGMTGCCYALPTRNTPRSSMALAEVGEAVSRFLGFARKHEELSFRLTRVGCGLAGFRDEDIAPLFFPASPNVILPGRWQRMKDGETVRLIVAGSRTVVNKDYVFTELDRLTEHLRLPENRVTEICGDTHCVYPHGARGVDALGREWAESRNIPVECFAANQECHGKAAGMLRNKVMANHGTHLVALWDGLSPGTRQMIEVARSFGLDSRVLRTDWAKRGTS